MAKLTELQKRFSDEYLIDLNGTEAALRAGVCANVKDPVKRRKSAAEYASQLLKKTQVAEYIQKRMQDRESRTEITQDMVIIGLLKEAEREGENSSHNARVSAWGHLGKHLGMFVEKREYSGPNNGPIVVKLPEELL